jgi:hypothetical protein
MKSWSCFSSRAACPGSHRMTTEKCYWCGAKRPANCFPPITDTERLDRVLKFLNQNPVTSHNGFRSWTRQSIDAAIRAGERNKI